MKSLIMSFTIALATVSALAKPANIEGSWGLKRKQNGLKFNVTFVITKETTTIINQCKGFGSESAAQVTVKSNYTENKLNILESAQNVNNDGELDCNVSVVNDSLDYSIKGNKLILSSKVAPGEVILKRKQ